MILDRYLRNEVAGPLLGVGVTLVVIFATYSLGAFLTDASSGLISPAQVAVLTGLKTLIALEVLLPIGLYVAILIGMGRLYTDSEMDALRAAGIGEMRLLTPLLRLAILLAVLVALLSVAVRPWAYHTSYQLREQAKIDAEIERIAPGRFYHYDDGRRTVFIERASDGLADMEGVFIRSRDASGLEVISSRKGRFASRIADDRHELALVDANLFKATSDGPDVFGTFDTFTLRVPIRQPAPLADRPKMRPTAELFGTTDPNERAELQWRLSTPVSTLLLALLAIPLSRSKPRAGRYGKLLLALGLYVLYFNLLGMARTWVEQQSLASIWWVPGLLAGITIAALTPWRRLRARFAKSRHAPA
jgi:lipopolysaccharide export system permease protein